MAKDRREFLKKGGVLGLSGLFSPFSVFSEGHDFLNFQQNSYLIARRRVRAGRCAAREDRRGHGRRGPAQPRRLPRRRRRPLR